MRPLARKIFRVNPVIGISNIWSSATHSPFARCRRPDDEAFRGTAFRST
jgi:hypothetical protein